VIAYVQETVNPFLQLMHLNIMKLMSCAALET